MDKKNLALISSITFWENEIEITPIKGGITNQNFLVTDNSKKYFVRIGNDIPEHLVFRANEVQASIAASKIGVCPELLFHNRSIQIFRYVDGLTLDSSNIKKNLSEIIKLLKKVHNSIPEKLVGQSVIFWVFHVIKNYKKFLDENSSEYIKILPDLLSKAQKLEKKIFSF